ncbi:sensor domain-containing phosphodiesterase [Aestuariivirga litoralis]|uniref:sensor domain-containing phosphodiesterase n=1 Tax=Aestuariivirga litoralis TaxID=2650924 RepID=UPI0018C713E6|nr:EAL domain-containing protein [Aestuariivirga litoralis]MBG1231104.1 EAL domain-containing protein [Aestuariivirga litoralis]
MNEHVPSTKFSPAVSDNIDSVLSAIRTYLGMDVAFLSEFRGELRVFRSVSAAAGDGAVKVGSTTPLAEGYCKHVVEGTLPQLIPNTADVPAAMALPETLKVPIGSHLSVPIRLSNGAVFGTFCSFSYEAKPGLSQRDLDLLQTFAEVVGRQIDEEIGANDETETRRARIRADLRKALVSGDPRIVYQPICNLADGKVNSVEALARFSSKTLQAPGVWYAEATEVGAVETLELLAVKRAIKGAKDLPGNLAIGINASAATILSAGFADALDDFNKSRIILELTERGGIDDYPGLMAALAPLRAKGMRIAIDDIGLGYSSLQHLLDARPDIIKFDNSITQDIENDRARQALVAAMVTFAQHANAAIVAEGIETAAQLQVLRKLGVQLGQGYYFSAAVPAEEISKLTSFSFAT